jgi:hypothetical protein
MKGLLFAHEIVKVKEGVMVSDDDRLAKVPFSPIPLPVYYTTLPLGWIASQCHLCYNRECNYSPSRRFGQTPMPTQCNLPRGGAFPCAGDHWVLREGRLSSYYLR